MKTNEVSKIYAQMAELFTQLSEAFAEDAKEPVEKPVEKVEKTPAPVKEKTEDSGDKKSEEELKKLPFNALKKYAASLGVSATGKRDDIIARIVGGVADDDVEVEDTPEEEKKKPTPAKKKEEKKEVVEDTAEDAEDEGEDSVEDIADMLLEENDVSDIIDELKEAGMRGITKRNVKKKLVEAIEKGLIDLEDDDDEDDDTDDSDEEEIDEHTYFEDYDDEDGANNPKNVKEKSRLKVMVETQKNVIEDVVNGDLDTDEMRSFLLENSTEDEQQDIEGFDEDDVLAAYCEMMKRYIDDDGDDYSDSDDPYYVNGEIYAHAHKCSEVDGEYVDEVNGETFELDE